MKVPVGLVGRKDISHLTVQQRKAKTHLKPQRRRTKMTRRIPILRQHGLNGKEQRLWAGKVRQVLETEKHGCGVIPANIGARLMEPLLTRVPMHWMQRTKPPKVQRRKKKIKAILQKLCWMIAMQTTLLWAHGVDLQMNLPIPPSCQCLVPLQNALIPQREWIPLSMVGWQ